jgi:phenylacetic acid degradation operon negative regulatory protein
VFRAQTQLVHEWRKFPFLDPDLPDGMLPARWPRERAHDLFHEKHAAWEDDARAWFAGLETGGARTAA